jgi:hypothetical protein
MSELARQWRRATGDLPGAATRAVAPTSQDEVHRFVRSQVQLFLDHRAKRAHPGRVRARNPRPRRGGHG